MHFFPSIWMTFSIIPIHKMGKALDSPASFWPISLASGASKIFEHIILSRLLFFMETNSIPSPRQAGFYPGWSTLDQILFLAQSVLDGFNKPRLGSRKILSIIDFSKAFDSVWHPALFYKLISADFHPVVVVIPPPLPRGRGTAQTAIQVHAVNLIQIRLGENDSPFRTSHE